MTDSIEFVNDWSELEAAVAWLVEYSDDPDLPTSREHAVQTVAKYVPRLLTQYAKLVELSFALTEGWETYATLNPPSGLHLPDHR
jgi:phytoene dehydrogenase-like protein